MRASIRRSLASWLSDGSNRGTSSKAGIVAGVLLVLRGVHARVVCHAGHKPALHADVAQRHEGIGSHIQPHMLHGHNGARPGQGGSGCHLEGHLLIGGPLAVDFRTVLGQVLQDLGGGGAGIARADRNTGLVGPTGYGLIAGEQSSQILFTFA